jgi:CheY-like chemotaxis protein
MTSSAQRPEPIRCEMWGMASPPQKDRTRVVVVDDDHPDTAHVMALAPKIEGFEVTTALDGKTGMLRVADDEPDVVLLDITLPDMSGVEVARRIRETTSRNIAIIAVTSLGFEHVQNASFPNWEGKVQKRSYELKGNELSYRVAPRPNGDVPISIWQRLN